MAIFNGELRSDILGMDTGVNIILPYDRPAENQQNPCKVLYLLHGLSNCHTTWCRNTNIEKYVEQYGIAVVMPEVQRSFYIDMKYGLKYFTYITQELPKLIGQMFNVSQKPEETFIAGVSMGGYGAIKCAFTYPDNYAACCSFSGAVDINTVVKGAEALGLENELIGVIGPDLKVQPENNLFELAKDVRKNLPIYLCCGTEDELYADNIRFKQHLEGLGLNLTYSEGPGAHEWSYWDSELQKVLKFFNNVSK